MKAVILFCSILCASITYCTGTFINTDNFIFHTKKVTWRQVTCCSLSTLNETCSKSRTLYGDNNFTIDPYCVYGPSFNSIAKLPPGILPPSGCPLCDASVYTYCSNKMIHDSCCCNGPLGFNGGIGFNCPVSNCAYLHANSCYEHSLITNCCCNSPYRK